MTTSVPDIILLRGAPAAGKSTLGKRLRTHYPKGFVIEVDDVRGMINSVKWVHKEEHLRALDATAALAQVYLGAGYTPAIIVDTFNPSKLRYFIERFPGRTVQIISLWSSNEVLEQRLMNREKGFKDWDMTKILNDEVGKYRHPLEMMIDTTAMNKDEVLARFLELVKPAMYA